MAELTSIMHDRFSALRLLYFYVYYIYIFSVYKIEVGMEIPK